MEQIKSIVKSVKVPGGKLLEIELIVDIKERKVKALYITGDFFVYPPEVVDEAEKSVKDTKISYDLVDKVVNIMGKGELYGITLNHVKSLLKEAIEEALRG